jgi:hypothetical protein
MEELLQSVLDILVQRTERLQALQQTLLEGQSALVESALDRMEQAQKAQLTICRQIAGLDEELHAAYRALRAMAGTEEDLQAELERMGPGVVGRVERVSLTHYRLQARVHELAKVQQALLRRSEKTLQAMQNGVAGPHSRYRRAATGAAAAYSAMQE